MEMTKKAHKCQKSHYYQKNQATGVSPFKPAFTKHCLQTLLLIITSLNTLRLRWIVVIIRMDC